MWLVRKFGISVAVLIALLAAPTAASAAPDYTWNGLAPLTIAGSGGTPDPTALSWSNPNNWGGGVAPSGSAGTLTFPALGSACVPDPKTGTTPTACYNSQNDLPGINVNAIEIGGGSSGAIYHIGGAAQVVLGAGGLTVTPDFGTTSWTESDITAPLSLSAPQTWTINGTSYVGSLYIDGDVSGPSNPLNVSLNNGNFAVGADVETAAISFSGPGSVFLGNALGPYFAGALNGNNGNPVSLGQGESMFDQNTNRFDKNAYDLGSLTLADNSSLAVGQPEYSAPVTLPVNGGITLSPTSHLSLLFNSQITATGPVNLGGAKLTIQDGVVLINGSPACNILDVDTLLTTTGPLTGTFGGIPDGTVISLPCGLPVQPLARINYTAHSVIATLLQRTTTALDVSNATPPAGRSVTVTATVTPERVGESVPSSGTVEFLDGGQPITGCLAQPLAPGTTSSSASCDLSFQAEGTRKITATYSGNSTFLASTTSTPRVIVVQPAASSHQPPKQGVSLASATIPVQGGGVASVKLDCKGQAGCHGALTLTVKRKRKKGTTTIGTSQFSIATGRHTVEVKLNGTGKRLLAGAGGRLEATLLIGGSGGGGQRRVALLLMGPRAGR